LGDPYALIRWSSCPKPPLVWFGIRDALFHLFVTPALLLPLLAGLLWIATATMRITRSQRISLLGTSLLCLSLIYTPLGTHLLSSWLLLQLPQPTTAQPSVAVLVGRGAEIAQTSTTLAAGLERWGMIQTIYVSGDQRATAERLIALGVPPAKVAGDDCARTTWENAILTTAWLRQQNPDTPFLAITLITDPWQLPRASLAFQRQGVMVKPMAAPVDHLSAREQNRFALRETAALLLYRIQRRA
jgi:uncharacterized SAM-binding protein YcdF (DUF218 family)